MNKNDFTGILLAGGRSSRFGSDKRFAKLGNDRIIDRVVNNITPLVKKVIIAHGKKLFRYKDITCVDDIDLVDGPIAGLLPALAIMNSPYAVLSPCDMPLVPIELFKYLMSLISGNEDIIVPVLDEHVQPLLGIYSKKMRSELHKYALSGRDSLQEFLSSDAVIVKHVHEKELKRFGRTEDMFININTPDDYIRAELIIKVKRTSE